MPTKIELILPDEVEQVFSGRSPTHRIRFYLGARTALMTNFLSVDASTWPRWATHLCRCRLRPRTQHAEDNEPLAGPGSDFLMDGGVTASYWFGELAPK